MKIRVKGKAGCITIEKHTNQKFGTEVCVEVCVETMHLSVRAAHDLYNRLHDVLHITRCQTMFFEDTASDPLCACTLEPLHKGNHQAWIGNKLFKEWENTLR